MKITSKAIFSLLLTVLMLTSCYSFLPMLNTQPTQAVKTATSIARTTITETQTASPTETSTAKLLPLATPLPTINLHPTPLPTASLAKTSEFIEPDSETFVSLYPALLEYFYYRKQAVIGGDVQKLWENFPELHNNNDIQQGINAEEFIVGNYRSLKPFDGNIFPEYYERFKVKFTDKYLVEILIHGMELYTWRDEGSKFEESGGEFKVVLYLRLQNNQWKVYCTDEVTMNEWHQFSP